MWKFPVALPIVLTWSPYEAKLKDFLAIAPSLAVIQTEITKIYKNTIFWLFPTFLRTNTKYIIF